MYQSAAPYARELALEGVPLIAYNGGLVREFPSGRTIAHQPIPLETSKALAAFCEARNYHLQSYVDDQLYVPDLGIKTQQYQAIAGVRAQPVGSLFLWQTQPATKLLIIDTPQRIPQIQREVAELLGPSVTVLPSYPQFLEIFHHQVSKGAALKAAAEALGVEREAVLAIGDGMNDISMLTWAGTSFAMSQAPAAVKKVATHVTVSGPGLGVLEMLERMGLIESDRPERRT
jgi:Cof subfamily protein (haloacid dehalogenase superfamily)